MKKAIEAAKELLKSLQENPSNIDQLTKAMPMQQAPQDPLQDVQAMAKEIAMLPPEQRKILLEHLRSIKQQTSQVQGQAQAPQQPLAMAEKASKINGMLQEDLKKFAPMMATAALSAPKQPAMAARQPMATPPAPAGGSKPPGKPAPKGPQHIPAQAAPKAPMHQLPPRLVKPTHKGELPAANKPAKPIKKEESIGQSIGFPGAQGPQSAPAQSAPSQAPSSAGGETINSRIGNPFGKEEKKSSPIKKGETTAKLKEKCPDCGKSMQRVSIKWPHTDDFKDECSSPSCKSHKDTQGLLQDSKEKI
jgi:hypothetical protein